MPWEAYEFLFNLRLEENYKKKKCIICQKSDADMKLFTSSLYFKISKQYFLQIFWSESQERQRTPTLLHRLLTNRRIQFQSTLILTNCVLFLQRTDSSRWQVRTQPVRATSLAAMLAALPALKRLSSLVTCSIRRMRIKNWKRRVDMSIEFASVNRCNWLYTSSFFCT